MLGTILSFVSLPPNSTGRAPSSSRLRPTDPLVTSELMRGPLLRGKIGPWQIQVYTPLSRLRRVRRLPVKPCPCSTGCTSVCRKAASLKASAS